MSNNIQTFTDWEMVFYQASDYTIQFYTYKKHITLCEKHLYLLVSPTNHNDNVIKMLL